jgi:predicted acetyltransferase
MRAGKEKELASNRCFVTLLIMQITLELTDLSGPLPTATYDIYSDDELVGYCQLRHQPGRSEGLPVGFESHIYYEIKEPYRGRGYAKEALKHLLSAAKRIELEEVILTVAEKNIPSQHIIEAYAAELLDTAVDTEGTLHRKYRIKLRRNNS